MTRPPVVFLLGPTCSGKSAAGARLAHDLGGEVVSLDSMQVYRGLPVLTAQPDPTELALASHHLVDCLEPTERLDAVAYVARARAVLDDLAARDRPAVFVGGTWYYFRALVDGFDDAIPRGSDEVRQALALEFGDDPARLHRALALVDPPSAERLHPNDRRRVVRALEIHRLTGRPMSELMGTGRTATVTLFRGLWLDLDRDTLYRRLDERVDRMMAMGALDEVRTVLATTPEDATVRQALGVRQLGRHLAGETTLAAAVEELKRDTRHYARRQLSFLRGEGRLERLPVAPDEPAQSVARRLVERVDLP